MNWAVIILVGIAVIILVAFLIIRNQKDEKRFEKQLDSDVHKKDPEQETDTDEIMK